VSTGPKVYGHRGIPAYAPENTMAGFRQALEVGVDGLEIDVHLTKDGVVVVCHDASVDRTTDGTGLIRDYTYEELRKLDAGSWMSEKYRGERIPRLDEVLELLQGTQVWLNIELKYGVGLEEKVNDLVRSYKMEKRVIISSFDHYRLVRMSEIAPDLPTGILYQGALYRPWEYAKMVGAAALHPYFHTLTPDVAAGAKQAGIMINAWTVNEPEDIRYMLELGVDGIITNRADLVLEILGR
jgi:glycerophosphoryl diester phosphodiesterase